MEGYQKPLSVCFLCDHVPLQGYFYGTVDHEGVARFPYHRNDLGCLSVRVINRRATHGVRLTHGERRLLGRAFAVGWVKYRVSPKVKQG
jgi:hypothetical protein